ncbi:MAG TPA: type VI secretion system baseplate subunit TssK [Longimicrobiaceae bacterium]
MSSLGRVVWHEGMHLSQHHFQAQSRYFEELIRFVATSLAPETWGLAGYELDAEALRNDTVALVHARGLMPDGLPFQFPEDPLPSPLPIRELFSPTRDSHLVLLAIPPFVEGRPNLSSGESETAGVRFASATKLAVDEAGGVDTREVLIARKNFRLLLDAEVSEDLVTLPLARVRRDGSGHFVYDQAFIPPLLRIGGSSSLLSALDSLMEKLSARAASLAEASGSPETEVADHWLAHTLHESLGTLGHYRRLRQAHPAALFAELARLAGALCTFSMHAHPRDLPTYDHARPWESFGDLMRRIVELLDVVAPSNTIRIPVRPVAEAFYAATVTDPRAFGNCDWYLAVRSRLDPAELAGAVPRLVNICSARHIDRLVREAIPGLIPKHVLSPPPGAAPRAGTEYFSIPRTGPCWTSIVDTREVGLYVPAALAEPELEIIVTLHV